MKLNEIKNLKDSPLVENVIPPHVSMPLARILDDGKFTDSVQVFTLAGLIDMFKSGTGPWPRNFNFEFSVGADQIDAVKKLSDSDLKEVTEWILKQLANASTYESRPRCADPAAQLIDWVKTVTRKQD